MEGLHCYVESRNRLKKCLRNWVLHSIYEDLDHTLWVVTMGRGLFTFKYNGIHEKITVKTMPFISNYITTIFEDSRKRLWIGTEETGFFFMTGQMGHLLRLYLNWIIPDKLFIRL